jgi:hypothetical protein
VAPISVGVVQWGTLPAWVAAGLSLIFGILSWLSSRKSKAERDEATAQADRAERAADAAKRQADAADRSAAAVEAQERRDAEATAEAEADPWDLAPIPGDPNCYLINTSKTAKYDITVNGFEIHNGPARFDMIGPGERVELSIMRIMHPDDSVEVAWYPQEGLSDRPATMRKTIPSRI